MFYTNSSQEDVHTAEPWTQRTLLHPPPANVHKVLCTQTNLPTKVPCTQCTVHKKELTVTHKVLCTQMCPHTTYCAHTKTCRCIQKNLAKNLAVAHTNNLENCAQKASCTQITLYESIQRTVHKKDHGQDSAPNVIRNLQYSTKNLRIHAKNPVHIGPCSCTQRILLP